MEIRFTNNYEDRKKGEVVSLPEQVAKMYIFLGAAVLVHATKAVDAPPKDKQVKKPVIKK